MKEIIRQIKRHYYLFTYHLDNVLCKLNHKNKFMNVTDLNMIDTKTGKVVLHIDNAKFQIGFRL